MDVLEAEHLLSPLEVVGKTGPRRQEELNSHTTPVTMIWLVRSHISLYYCLYMHVQYMYM